ncbi:MAG: 50S ribosomal protein L3 N(5)-glutamine methyltransferase [Betaproteobacteria bacterium]|nr:MAG: 50S ribosomal protein L3 N(5)-glutamine methyltransferase [Betaproteobacteria bacterium]
MTALAFAATCPHELETIADWWRFAISSLTRADVALGQGTDRVEDDAAFLILGALSLPLGNLDEVRGCRLTVAERDQVFSLLKRRVVDKVPTAYLLGFTEQMGVRFVVNENVLIPRSYIGELLATQLAPWIESPDEPMRVLDLCTGSGCLAILAADAFPAAEIWASDISDAALDVARRNCEMHGLGDNITLRQGDLFASLNGERFDLILSNPPYVTSESMAALPEEFRHEPALALAAGDDGCDVLVRMFADAPKQLNPKGLLVVDIGHNRDLVEARFPKINFTWLATEGAESGVFLVTREQLL